MKKVNAKLLSAVNSASKLFNPLSTRIGRDEPDSHSIFDISYQRILDRDIYLHISEVSVCMVGVCLTGVSILQIDDTSGGASSYVDDLLAIDSFIFLTSCLLAYWLVRVAIKGPRYVQHLASIANLIFMLGMIVMVIVCGCIAIQGDYSFGSSLQK
jgi:hypothetical protein